MILPKNVIYILDTLEMHGFEGYVVGGCVRDYLMGNTPLDYDITTSATPHQVISIFEKTVDTGANFGTITVVLDGTNYELTTYRTETAYDDFRKPSEVAFSLDISEDLLRRDFTINAIAYHPTKGYLDLYGGIEDIKNKIVKAVGNPTERFTEDALRMLRCIRFSTKLDFDIDTATYDALIANRGLIGHISIERIREELVKTLLSKKVEKATLINETHILKPVVSDELYSFFNENLEDAIAYIKIAPQDIGIRLAILMKELYNLKKELVFLKFSNVQIKEITKLVSNINKPLDLTCKYTIKKLILDLNLETLDKFLEIKKVYGEDINTPKAIIKEILDNNEPISLKELAVSGGDLVHSGAFKAGKILGIILEELHDRVLRNPDINNKETLTAMSREIGETTRI